MIFQCFILFSKQSHEFDLHLRMGKSKEKKTIGFEDQETYHGEFYKA